MEEIRAYIEAEEEAEREIGMVIFDDELSAKQLRNIEKELKVKILDRTSLILDISSPCVAQTSECQDASGVGPVPRCCCPSATLGNLGVRGGGSGSGGGKGSVGLRGQVRHSWRWTRRIIPEPV